MSDTHVTPADPAGMARFVRFLDGPARAADRVIVAGDLFDVWVSPSQSRLPGMAPVLRGLSELAASGVDVGFVEGNRDFAASGALRKLGVRTLPDELVIESGGRRFAVTHGDQLCTADVTYQVFRRIVRTSLVRHLLERLPSTLVVRAGDRARATSKSETARKPYGDMALVPTAVASLLRRHDADALVCGHVHWGRRHVLAVDGVPRDVVVLPAWEDRAAYVRIAGGCARFVPFEG